MSYETVNGLFTGIADAIRSVDGTVDPIAHQDIPTKIGGIPAAVTAAFTADATATESDILLGETAYAGGEKLTGTLTTADLTVDATATAADIAFGKTAYGSAGTKLTGTQSGIVVTEFDVSMNPVKATVLGETVWIGAFDSAGVGNSSWDELTEIFCPDATTAYINAFYALPKVTSITAPKLASTGGSCIYANTLLASLTLPELATAIGYAIYSNPALTTLILPKLTTTTGTGPLGNNFALTSCQLGSVGNPVTSLISSTFNAMDQAGLTITIYVTPGKQPISGSPWGATNATIVYCSAVDGSVL